MSEAGAADSPRDLNRAAMQAMASRDLQQAERLLHRALRLEATDLPARLNLAACQRLRGDLVSALSTAESALAIDARCFPALLMRASLLDRLDRRREAGEAYGIAVAMAPAAEALDPPTRKALELGRQRHAEHVREAAAYLDGRVLGLAGGDGPALGRARASIGHYLRTRRRFHQEPVQFYYPGLPAIPFYDREEFPWLEALEAATPQITAELLGVLDDGQTVLTPYVDYGQGLPLDQWAALNRSLNWSAFHLCQHGGRVEENASRCPATLAALAKVDQPHIPHRSPAAMFSILKPGVRLPPHTGVSNTRLVGHLPLVVPPGCGFRVGDETRTWQHGVGWVFDDTIEHEAWNESDQTRAILIFDVWSPRLTADDRRLITELMVAMDDFAGGGVHPLGL